MNLLTNYKLIDDTFKSLTETVLVNDEPHEAIISTAYLGASEKRHIASLDKFSQGDYVQHRGSTYLVMEETETKRHNKYRASMTHCNFLLELAGVCVEVDTGEKDWQGRPITETVCSDPVSLPAVVSDIERSYVSGGVMETVTTTFFLDLQDSEATRELLVVNSIHDFKGGNTIQVRGLDFNQNGRLGVEVRLE